MAKRGRFRWQEEHVAFFCEIVPGHSQGEVADMFEDRFGVRLSVSQVKNAKMRYHVRSGTSGGQFKPGQKAWNKGVPASEWISPEAMERCKASRFQHGNIPLNAKAFKVGDERVSGMASRAKDKADDQRARAAIEPMMEPLMELADQMETLGKGGFSYNPSGMVEAAQTIKAVLCR